MKKILLSSILVCSLLFAVGCILDVSSKEKYTTLPAEGKTMEVKSFKAIKAEGVINLILSQGTKESVVVKGELPQGLSITNNADTLVITDTLGGNIHNNHFSIKTDIYVTLVDVKSINIESVGETKCADTLKLKNLDFYSEGVGATTLWINADTVNATEEGVGKVTMAGKAASAKIDDSGVGALDAKQFKADVLHLNVSGVGAAKVYAIKEIYLESDGVGGVQYNGPAKVMKNESDGVGKIEHGD